MGSTSKRGKKLVEIYRKAVERQEALKREKASDPGLSDECKEPEEGLKVFKKEKPSKKDKALKDSKKDKSQKSSKKVKKSKKIKHHPEGEPIYVDQDEIKAALKVALKDKDADAKRKSEKNASKKDRGASKRMKGVDKVGKFDASSKPVGSSRKIKPDGLNRKMQIMKPAIARSEGRDRDLQGFQKDPKVQARSSRETIEQFQKKHPYMQNRELSWLEFNKRVLDQGSDASVPLFERLGFISIFWSNLQEFFMVRVGSLTDLSLVKKTIIDTKSGMTPSEQLDAIYDRCHELYPYYEQCYKEVRGQLGEHGIANLTHKELSEEQVSYAEDYFTHNVMPFLSPQIINARHPFPHLENGALYIVVRLDEDADIQSADKGSKSARSTKEGKDTKKKKSAKNLGAEGVTLGLIPLPRQCKRIVQLPGDGLQFILLEHMIEMFVPKVFSMYKVKHTNVICVTRNADLDATEGTEEQGEDYREHMKRIIKKRSRLAPVRLESERELSQTVKPVLMNRLNLRSNQVFVTSVPLNMSYIFDLPSLVDEGIRAKLTSPPFTPQWPSSLDRTRSIIEQVSEREVLLSYPYESMDAFVQLLREAAVDPDVISIKITLYRLAKQSHLAEALIAAADAGKEVTALFELRARFDESNNIEWSQRFDQAGCNVLYGFRDFKVHSKICCITRQTENGLQYITQLGTGNYNEKTAKLYTDFSFITTDLRIGLDAMRFFRNMALENTSDDYNVLWVAPLQIKQNILAGIDDQIRKHKSGEPTGIFFKTNSITDKDIIDKIVEASQAGVKCTLLVRGISCIVPGIEGYTDNVCVDSIVGRLLEHSRIYCFGPFDGDVSVYLSSADLMTRNMDKRIEIAWPVENEELRDQVIGYIGTCMSDTAKLRDLLPNREYTPLGFFGEINEDTGQVELFDSQNFLIYEAAYKRLEAIEEAASVLVDDPNMVRELEKTEAAKMAGTVETAEAAEAVGEPEAVGVSDAADEDADVKAASEVDAQVAVEKNVDAEDDAVQVVERSTSSELPLLAGVPTYEVLSADQASDASQTWSLPNFESGSAIPMHIGESSYTDPNVHPAPIIIPEEKISIFKRLFKR